MNFKPLSAALLALAGILLIGTGLYFIFLRPALLPEDLKFIGTTSQNVKDNLPSLLLWLPKLFWVMGGYILTTGVLVLYISHTSFRNREQHAFTITVMAGFTSIGLMTMVNFLINSDFKWILLVFTLPWAMALILYQKHK
ncbi:hypothetical protein [Adhaeribacter aquaticus]|uniref:hypothetical protein n=1 Tax=Adhaeribacter aquaticus TaxID=299567 RepID=UPI0004274D61|nr:hypothetical protein [Adhaeribacter aquaticus]